jgi:GT2 family glycosyltransferase
MPSLSVILPVKNLERFLAEAIESVLLQTFRDFELLVCDDGSTDGSVAIAEAFAVKDSRVRVLRQESMGLVRILNYGLEQASAPLVARMDGDDVALPKRFEKQVGFMAAHPDCVLVGSSAQTMDEEGWPVAAWTVPTEHEQIDGAHITGQQVNVIHPTTVYRRAMVLQVGGYRPVGKVCEDVDLWLRLAEIGRLANLPEQMLRYRLRAKSFSSVYSAEAAVLFTRVAREARGRRGLGENGLAKPNWQNSGSSSLTEQSFNWALQSENAGNFHTAAKHARRVAFRQPWRRSRWVVWWRNVRKASGQSSAAKRA